MVLKGFGQVFGVFWPSAKKQPKNLRFLGFLGQNLAYCHNFGPKFLLKFWGQNCDSKGGFGLLGPFWGF